MLVAGHFLGASRCKRCGDATRLVTAAEFHSCERAFLRRNSAEGFCIVRFPGSIKVRCWLSRKLCSCLTRKLLAVADEFLTSISPIVELKRILVPWGSREQSGTAVGSLYCDVFVDWCQYRQAKKGFKFELWAEVAIRFKES